MPGMLILRQAHQTSEKYKKLIFSIISNLLNNDNFPNYCVIKSNITWFKLKKYKY